MNNEQPGQSGNEQSGNAQAGHEQRPQGNPWEQGRPPSAPSPGPGQGQGQGQFGGAAYAQQGAPGQYAGPQAPQGGPGQQGAGQGNPGQQGGGQGNPGQQGGGPGGPGQQGYGQPWGQSGGQQGSSGPQGPGSGPQSSGSGTPASPTPSPSTPMDTGQIVRIVLHAVTLIVVVLGISLDMDGLDGNLWGDSWTWASFATLMALAQGAALLPKTVANGIGWTIGAIGAAGLLLFWTLLMLPMISTNMAFMVTVGTACAAAAVMMSPDRKL